MSRTRSVSGTDAAGGSGRGRVWKPIGLAVVACAGLSVAMAGCSSGPETKPDALTTMRNPELGVKVRVDAAEQLWNDVQAGQASGAQARRAMMDLAWSDRTPLDLRVRTLEILFADTDEQAQRDVREMVRLRLPRERDRFIVKMLSETAAQRGWAECVPALVRAYSRTVEREADLTRPERLAIQTLSPGRDVEAIVFGVFLSPPPEPKTLGMSWEERFQIDAWDLMNRLDRDGRRRRALVEDPALSKDASSLGQAVLADVRAMVESFGVMPATGQELLWARQLRSKDKPGNQAWWERTSAAVKGLGESQRSGLAMRHLEAVRWASVRRPAWLSATREELRAELGSRLGARTTHQRTADTPITTRRRAENLDAYADRLVWADYLAMLVVDEALASSGVAGQLFEQARLDMRDESTEYGGLIAARLSGRGALFADGAETFAVTMFTPRPNQREGNEVFVASDDMVQQGDQSLAHYHFHAQKFENKSFAGPSEGDMAYATRSGRGCVVFTMIDKDTMNADYYQPDGAVVDLGEIKRPVSAAAGVVPAAEPGR
ncbi:MAG: hypothetical protein SFY95_08205 [Planctomycetota bacterium]|nr:hypothetical protein [Planctomycetota bacterium]